MKLCRVSNSLYFKTITYLFNFRVNYEFSFFKDKFKSIFLPLLVILKIRLKGKTMRIRKMSKYIFFFKAGKTHLIRSYIKYGTMLKKKSKQKYFFFGHSLSCLMFSYKSFSYWKEYNIYH